MLKLVPEQKKLKALLMVVFLVFFIETADAGCIGEITDTNYGCGDTVIESCTFDESLICSMDGLMIGADGIVIDGDGYTLTGTGDGKDGIHNEDCDCVTIKNMDIRDFCFGIYFTGADNGSITNNSISYGAGSGIWLHNSIYNEIIGNKIYHGDDGHGILLSSSANKNMVGYNNITTSNGAGVCIEESDENKLYHNYICGNRRGDIIVAGLGNTGDNNTCSIAKNFNCIHVCPSSPDKEDEAKTNQEEADHSCGCVSDTNLSKIFACGDTVTENCTFNCDLGCKNEHGLIIGVDDITIDGDGYALDGVLADACDDWEERSGIYNPGYDNIAIKNLEIKNFCNGIYLEGTIKDTINRNTIDSCDIHHNGNNNEKDTQTHGIKMRYVYNTTISDNEVHHNLGKGDSCENGGNGIFLYAGDYNLITNNTVYGNAKAGIFTKMKPKYNNISSNTVTENGQGGIVLRCKLSSLFVIENNIASGNKGVGIYVGGEGNTLKDNTVADNRNGSIYGWDGTGVWIDREAYNTTLVSNDVTGNDYMDVKVKEGLTGTEGYNNTYETTSNYEDLIEGENVNVKGRRVESKYSNYNYTEREKAGLSSTSVTPLAATLLLSLVLLFVFYGYFTKR
ncbi:MAG: Right handed beta helix region [Candidatus Argoarchaeum ethanivorans]|uniref:Right handed beta helix region n=1 Tax=Candidatus Argoarchaeum ethanivorans TaxID=2608793 RepID=A0A811TE90_9EURY|nr:MAG: Right handed beta helix region [Candidatus Argoarchaeum ethanivorans]